jgi:hypothetical protein
MESGRSFDQKVPGYNRAEGAATQDRWMNRFQAIGAAVIAGVLVLIGIMGLVRR